MTAVNDKPSTFAALRTMAWAQGRMLLHSYTRGPLILISVLLLLAFVAPVAGIYSVWALYSFRRWEPQPTIELLHVFLFSIWMVWVGLPLYGFSMSETMGTYNLRSFPVRSLVLFVGRCLSALVDVPVLFLAPPYLAVLFGYCQHSVWNLLVGLITLTVFTLNFVSGSVLLSSLMRLFPRSKRILVPLLIVLLLAAAPVAWLLPGRAFTPNIELLSREFLVGLGISRCLSFTPSGFAANTLIGFREGHAGLLLASFLGLAASTLLLLVAGSWANLRADLTSGGTGRTQPIEQMAYPSSPPATFLQKFARRLEKRFSPSMWAVMGKEVALFRRDPELLLYLIIIPALVIPLFLIWLLFGEAVPPAQRFSLSLVFIWIPLVGSAGLLFNLFGYDREGLASLFLSSASRRRILAGANVVVAIFVLGEVMFVSLFVWFFFKRWEFWLQTLLVLLVLLPILAAVGNFCSILVPYYVMRDRRGLHQAGMARVWLWGVSNLFAMALAFMLAMPAVLALTSLPILLRDRAHLWWITPVGLAYSLGLYLLSLRYGSRLLLSREPEILKRCSAPTGERG